jgi:uncharacterized protein (TIGR02145 family)
MKKLLLPLLTLLLLISCKKDASNISLTNGNDAALNDSKNSDANLSINLNTITICHKSGSTFTLLSINPLQLIFHLAHGDVVPDADFDGYTKPNPLGLGSQNDCDDTNSAIHPGADEMIDNGIDDNCNGQVDEIATVTICNQIWTLKNLSISKYRNGDNIPQVTDPTVWSNLTTGAWCWYNNDSAKNSGLGRLYNWFAVMDPRGLAPAGWHVPSIDEWITLRECLGGQDVAGNAMKEQGTAHWVCPNSEATNSSGFTALGAGYRSFIYNDGMFFNKDSSALWWSTTPMLEIYALNMTISSDYPALYQNMNEHQLGMSIRCVKD